jgi:hypothetical protein
MRRQGLRAGIRLSVGAGATAAAHNPEAYVTHGPTPQASGHFLEWFPAPSEARAAKRDSRHLIFIKEDRFSQRLC